MSGTGDAAANDRDFVLKAQFDQPELLGARWWNQRTASQRIGFEEPSRRDMLARLVLGATVVGIGGIGLAGARGCSRGRDWTPPADVPPRLGLELQRTQGWDTGSGMTPLTYGGATAVDATGRAFDRDRLRGLHERLAPGERLRPWYVPTLFQFVEPGDAQRTAAMRDLQPIHTLAMQTAHAQAGALRELLAGVGSPSDLALIIDLPGPQSIAFAAGLQPAAEAVFTFDNWPHPYGVVPSHLTLAAALFYEPLFAMPAPAQRVPAFVLDRARLTPYDDQGNSFNNRYIARLPDVAGFGTLGIKHVLYVVPDDATATELDDLVALFAALRGAGIDVRMISLHDFRPASGGGASGSANDATPNTTPNTTPSTTSSTTSSTGGPRYWFHGSPIYHWWFWQQHPWYPLPVGTAPQRPPSPSLRADWAPGLRPTMFDRLPPSRVGLMRDRVTERAQGSRPSGTNSGGGSWGSGGSWGRSSGWGSSS